MMALAKDTLDQLRHLLRPVATRMANAIVRGVVQLVDDSVKQQIIQIGALAGETIDATENFQPYGMSSVPLPGAETVTIFPNGDRGHPLTVAVSDRRYRPTGGQPGEVVMYTDEGDAIRLGRGHVVTVATSGTIKLGSSSASQGAIKGTQRDSAEQTFLTALNTYAVAIKAISDPGNVATPVLTAAITAFKSAVTAAVSTKVKLE
jgi:phage baseplate assembly protein V